FIVALLLPALQRDRHLLLGCVPGVRAGVLLRDRRLGGSGEPLEPLPLFGLEPPERVEAAVEGRELFVAGHQRGAQRQVDALAASATHRLQRAAPAHQPPDRQGETCRPEHLPKAEDGDGEVPRSRHDYPSAATNRLIPLAVSSRLKRFTSSASLST